MYQVTLLLAVTTGLPLASERSDSVGVVNATVRYRIEWIDGVTPFEPCSVIRSMGTSIDAIAERMRKYVGGAPTGCPLGARSDPRVHLVYIDSLSVADSQAVVHLRVKRGELHHRESYYLRRLSRGAIGPDPGTAWGLHRIEVYDLVQHHQGDRNP